MKRNKVFFEVLPTIKINPTTAYFVVSWLKWNWCWAMRVNWFNDWLLKITKLEKQCYEKSFKV